MRRVRLYVRNGVYHLDYNDGKRVRESTNLRVTRDNRIEAEKIRTKKLLDINNANERRITGRLTLSEGFAKFMSRKMADTKNYENYEFAYKIFIKYLDSDPIISTFTDSDLFAKFKVYLLKTRSHNTTANYMNHLRTIFAYFIEKGYLEKNPVIKLRYIKSPITTIPREHISIILKHLYKKDIRYYRFINFLYLSGFRRSEALSLKWEDVYFDREKPIISLWDNKENRYDIFPMRSQLVSLLQEFRQESGLVFEISKEAAKSFFRRLPAQLGLPHYTIHDLRRTFGWEMANIYKITPYQLQKLLRHEDLKTTTRYYVEGDLTSILDQID